MRRELKNSILSILCVINLFFLTGCLKKKKDEKKIITSESLEIETYEEEDNYKKSAKKSIFADEEDGNIEIKIEESYNSKNTNPQEISKSYDSTEEIQKKYLLNEPIFFEFNVRDSFKNDQKNNFDSIISEIENLLLKKKQVNLLIVGHACNSEGTDRYNMQLSDDRASTIKNLIIDIFPSIKNSISSYGKGTTELLIPTGNRKQQDKNRRVEIFVIE